MASKKIGFLGFFKKPKKNLKSPKFRFITTWYLILVDVGPTSTSIKYQVVINLNFDCRARKHRL